MRIEEKNKNIDEILSFIKDEFGVKSVKFDYIDNFFINDTGFVCRYNFELKHFSSYYIPLFDYIDSCKELDDRLFLYQRKCKLKKLK